MTVSTVMLSLALLAAQPGDGQVLGGSELAARVLTELQARLAESGSHAALKVVGRVADQSLPAGRLHIEPGTVAGRWPRERAGVPVRLSVDGRTVRNLTVWLSASDPRNVATYAEGHPAGTAEALLLIQQGVVDMVCCEGPVASPEQVAGMRLRHAVRKGEPVMLADLEPQPAVSAQQKVAVAVERGAVRIVTGGMALQDGVLGERIAVRPEHSRHTVSARVVAAGEVIVDE